MEEKRSMCWPWNRYHHFSYFLSYIKVNCSDLSRFILSLSPSAFYLSPDVYLSHSLSFHPPLLSPVSPHMCRWQCALNVYLFISFCYISFCVSVPDSFCLLVTIQCSDVCTAVLDRALEKHVFSLQTPCWLCLALAFLLFMGSGIFTATVRLTSVQNNAEIHDKISRKLLAVVQIQVWVQLVYIFKTILLVLI